MHRAPRRVDPHVIATDDRRATLRSMLAAEPERLRRRSISLGVPLDDADDVAQTVVLRAWRSIAHVESADTGRVCSWVDAIARNAAVDFARTRARARQSTLDETVSDPTDVAATVEDRALVEGALRAVQQLPATLREALLLSVADGLTAPQIAQRLGVSSDVVRQRISRARRELAKCRGAGMSPEA